MRVFVSAPLDKNIITPSQVKLKAAIVKKFVEAGLDPLLFNLRGMPLQVAWTFDRADKIMSQCRGAAILAFARHRYQTASGQPVMVASEYNHYEGALANSRKLPVLILAEEGVEDRGVTNRGSGEYIVTVPTNAKSAWLKSKEFKPYFDDWVTVIRARRDIFFGYCSSAQATADAIMKYLQNVVKVSVTDWALDFDPGPTILTRIREAADSCHAGIFLFSKDDRLAGSKAKAAPRDNVVFEAGYFMHAKGPNRVLVVRQEGAKMPADLGGNIFASLANGKSIDSIHEPLRKFCTAALDLQI